jgi:tRNA(Ile2) C34 agmatinyltransferase TiaS
MKIICPECNTEIEAEIWDVGKCKKCGKEYWWDEVEAYDDPYDYVPVLEWD